MNKRCKKWMLAIATGLSILSISAPSFAATYQVRENDTFWKIANKQQVSFSTLMALNGQVDPLNLMPGQLIQIPDSVDSARAAKGAQIPAYSKVIDASSTAYTANPSENGGYGAVDYFGNPLKMGTISVDPSVIPLGSTLYIQGYSFQGLPEGGMYAKAADTGGAVKGNRIDIFVPGSADHAQTFGFQSVKVYILK